MKMEEKMEDGMMEHAAHKSKEWKHEEHGHEYESEWEGGSKEEHEMTTMSDVAECLKKDFVDEIHDSKKYLCMARIAECSGDEYAAHYLLEMAKDEYTHAAFIHDFMEKHNMCIHEEHETCYMKLKNEISCFF